MLDLGVLVAFDYTKVLQKDAVGAKENSLSKIDFSSLTMVVVFSADEILFRGLELGGFDSRRQKNVQRKTNLERFRALYGSNPVVYAEIFHDLQTTAITDARVDSPDVDSLLMSLRFLRCYPTETQQSGTFSISDRSVRKWSWFYVKKIQALKADKVCHWF